MRSMVQELLVRISRVTAEYIRGVVCGHVGVCGVILSCQMWSMPHIMHPYWRLVSDVIKFQKYLVYVASTGRFLHMGKYTKVGHFVYRIPMCSRKLTYIGIISEKVNYTESVIGCPQPIP